jgi:hypothetical protein
MELSEFLILYIRQGRLITQEIAGWSAWHYEKLAELTKHIDYQCHFNKKGVCKKYIQNDKYYKEDPCQCCCTGCAANMGYHWRIPNKISVIEEYAKRFHPKFGFWKKGEGCALPRKMRSPTCLSYNCVQSANNESFNAAERRLINLLSSSKPKTLKIRGKRYTDITAGLSSLEDWLISAKAARKMSKKKRA